MGLLVDGVWHNQWYDTASSGGKFERKESSLRNWITPDGSAGPTGEGGFEAATDRYHLYVSLACPWANRVLIMRALKDLEDMLPISVVHWLMDDNGWSFADGPGVIKDPINSASFMREVYTASDPHYSGRVTVPVLWDKLSGRIVSNESADILRMLNTAFNHLGASQGDYYPEQLRSQIDQVNSPIYELVNNGVYKAGFATTQNAYDAAVYPLFDALDWLEEKLGTQRYLVGDTITEADIRLFTTLVRFDQVYVGHFKCNQKRLVDHPNLWAYTRDLFQTAGFGETVNHEHIKRHYYESHPTVNPSGVVPSGPIIDFGKSHERDNLAADHGANKSEATRCA